MNPCHEISRISILVLFTAFASLQMEVQEPDAGKCKEVLTAPPQGVPSAKLPDGLLTGNGDIGLALGGTPDHLNFYFVWMFSGGHTKEIPVLQSAFIG